MKLVKLIEVMTWIFGALFIGVVVVILLFIMTGKTTFKTTEDNQIMENYTSFEIEMDVPIEMKNIKIGITGVEVEVDNMVFSGQCRLYPLEHRGNPKNETYDFYDITYEEGAWFMKTELTKYVSRTKIEVYIEKCMDKIKGIVERDLRKQKEALATWE